MKKVVPVFLAIFMALCTEAQNLVPNPSFEDYVTCPTAISMLPPPLSPPMSVLDWCRASGGSSDYFNTCAPNIPPFPVSIPQSFAGYQWPRTGNGYTGIYGNINYATDIYREYIEAPLLSPLVAGHQYYVCYWMSLGEWDLNNQVSGIDQFGAYFNIGYIDDPNYGQLPFVPQIVSPVGQVYVDTADWRSVSGTFTAAGGEDWITIGNFTPTELLTEQSVIFYPVISDLPNNSYYLIDDVCVLDLDGQPSNVIIHDTITCASVSSVLTGRSGMDNYLWDDGSTAAERAILTAGTYWVKSVDRENCEIVIDSFYISHGYEVPAFDLGNDTILCGGGTLLLNPDPMPAAGIFNWQDGTNTPAYSVTQSGLYWLKVSSECFSYSDTIDVLIFDQIKLLNDDTSVCAGTLIQLRVVGDTAFSYNWVPEQDITDPLIPNTTLNAQTSGYYTVTASYPECISKFDSFYVAVQPVPEVNIGPDRIICTYDTIQLYGAVMPASYTDYTYAWTPGSNLTDTTIQNPVFSGDGSVPSLQLQVTTSFGCIGTDTMMVTVFPGDFLTVIPEDTGACPPARLQLFATGASSYAWSPDYGLDAIDIANPIASPVSTTQYTVLGTKNYGNYLCYDTQSVNLRVYSNAVLYLPDSVHIWPGESYQIDPGGNCLYFEWFPPSGLSGTNISNPIAMPEVRTRYFVTARTEEGCTIYDSLDVLVNTESVLDIPNAFSPTTGDLKIVKRGIATLRYYRIFNRWGNKVFETTDINKGWDGRFNGKEQPMGVYIYSIEAVTSTGKPFLKNGNTTLLR